MTADNGEYRVAELAPGRYWICAAYRNPETMMLTQGAPARNPEDKPEEEYITTYHPGAVDPSGATALELDVGQELRELTFECRSRAPTAYKGK